MLNEGRTRWVQLLCGCLVCAFSGFVAPAKGQFVAFNDYAPGGGTHPNATTYGPGGSGKLKDIASGASGSANLLAYSSAITYGTLQGSPGYGTPAFIVFDGYVDFVGDPNPGIQLSSSSSLTYFFSGLDASAEYNLQATAIRGEPSYTDRWSLFQISGVRGFTSRHSAGTLTISNVPSLAASQVAINTGDNRQGEVAWWEHIRPSIDGRFRWYRQNTMGLFRAAHRQEPQATVSLD